MPLESIDSFDPLSLIRIGVSAFTTKIRHFVNDLSFDVCGHYFVIAKYSFYMFS